MDHLRYHLPRTVHKKLVAGVDFGQTEYARYQNNAGPAIYDQGAHAWGNYWERDRATGIAEVFKTEKEGVKKLSYLSNWIGDQTTDAYSRQIQYIFPDLSPGGLYGVNFSATMAPMKDALANPYAYFYLQGAQLVGSSSGDAVSMEISDNAVGPKAPAWGYLSEYLSTFQFVAGAGAAVLTIRLVVGHPQLLAPLIAHVTRISVQHLMANAQWLVDQYLAGRRPQQFTLSLIHI